ncbi:sigma-E factor negative regulatory protein [Vibrio agarilyticus]|nr:sigma-E factor negative regulatory protein [Vibrio agarilyticus]
MADKEQLSALMDGEVIDKALIQSLENDETKRTIWQNYHLIGDVMRGEAPAHPEWNIAERVALALEDELPHTRQGAVSAAVPLLESQPTPQQAKRNWPGWMHQMGQVAIAASVSLVVIFGVQQYSGESGQEVMPVTDLPVLETVPFAGSVEPVSYIKGHAPERGSEAQIQERHKRIQAMLHDYELQLRLNGDDHTAHQDTHSADIE